MTTRGFIGMAAAGLLAAAAALATSFSGSAAYELERATFPAGAGHATGGEFEMAFTIESPPSTTSAGGEFTVTGGVWVESPPGDCVYDGVVSLVDYSQLALCLSGPESDIASSTCGCFDLRSDHHVDLRDVAQFQLGFGH